MAEERVNLIQNTTILNKIKLARYQVLNDEPETNSFKKTILVYYYYILLLKKMKY